MFAGKRGGTDTGVISSARITAGIFVVLTLVCGLLFSRAEAQTYSFSRIEVEGNQLVEPATIAKIAGIGQGQAVSQAGLNDAVQRLVASGLFATAEVVPSGGTLVVRVTETRSSTW